jgi:hypothetical protein
VKGRAVARDPRVTIVVNDETPPYAIAMIEGVAEIITDQAELRRGTAEIARHYIEGEAAEGFVQYAASPARSCSASGLPRSWRRTRSAADPETRRPPTRSVLAVQRTDARVWVCVPGLRAELLCDVDELVVLGRTVGVLGRTVGPRQRTGLDLAQCVASAMSGSCSSVSPDRCDTTTV